MAKYSNGLFKEIQEQKELHDKYDINKEVAIVEKSNIVSTLMRIVQIGASVILLSLAMVGLLALIYPATRSTLLEILMNALNEIRSFVT